MIQFELIGTARLRVLHFLREQRNTSETRAGAARACGAGDTGCGRSELGWAESEGER
jgi:hypothetical protein